MICFVFTYVISTSRSVEPRSFVVVLVVDKIYFCYYYYYYYYYYILLRLESATPHFNHPYGYWCVGSVVPPWVHQTMVVGPEEASNGQVRPLKVSAELGDRPLNLANTLRGTDASARTFFPSCPHTIIPSSSSSSSPIPLSPTPSSSPLPTMSTLSTSID